MEQLSVVIEQYCLDVNAAHQRGFDFDHETFKKQAKDFALKRILAPGASSEAMLIYNMGVHCSNNDPYAFLYLMDQIRSKQPPRLEVLGALLYDFAREL